MGLASITNNILTDTGITPSGVISGTLSTGQVAYGSAANTIAGSNNLFWDAANNRLGIGTNAPLQQVDIVRDGAGSYYQSRTYRNSDFGGGFIFLHARGTISSPTFLNSGDRLASIFFKGYDGTISNDGNGASIESFASANHTALSTTADLRFSTTGTGIGVTENMRLTANGRLILQNGGTFTDSGQRLQVIGDTLLRGSGNTSATTGLTVQNSDGTNLLRVLNNGLVRFGSSGSGFTINPTSGPTYAIDIAGTNVNFQSNTTTQDCSLGRFLFNGSPLTRISDNVVSVNIASVSTFAPTSGQITGNGRFVELLLQSTINQTGTAVGTTRGLHINPTLTSAPDWRAIEALGKVIFTGETLTGSRADSLLSVSQTYNTTGSPALIYGNLTNTASGSNTSLLRLDISSSSVFTISPSGLLKFGAPATSGSGIAAVNPADGTGLVNGLSLAFYMSGGTQTGYDFYFRNFSGTRTATSGTNGSIRTTVQFNPTSGTGTYDVISIGNTINQVGATGITRGLYVNANLVAAADWRSIEWSNNSGWGLYGAGTAPNYMAGSLGIGGTGLTEVNLRLSKNISGSANSYAVYQNGQVQSGVTSNGYGFYNAFGTQPTAFTLPNYIHYESFQATIGVGSTVTNQFGFRANSTLIGATNNYGFYGDIASGTGRWNIYMNGTANNYMAGSLNIGGVSSVGIASLILQKTIAGTGGTVGYGLLQQGVVQSTITSFSMGFYNQLVTAAASFNLPIYYHYFAQQGTIGAGSTVGTQHGFAVDASFTAATTNYAFYSGITSGSGRWNLYMLGNADNYLAGSLGIGTTSLTGRSLFVALSLANASTYYGISSEGVIQSSVTTSARYFNSNSIVASGAAIPTIYHYIATQGTFQGTATNQMAFFAESTLTSATNNYGFYGNIASGTGRWNLYMNGTADNYMAGSLGIGTTAPSDILDIRKNQITTSVATTTSVLLSNTNASGIAAYVFTSDGTTRQGGLQYNNTTGQRNLFSCTYTDIPYHFGTNNLIRFTVTGSTGNVLIGSTTDSGERLQVNGTMKVTGFTSIGDNVLISKNQNFATLLNISNSTAGNISQSYLSLSSDINSGSGILGKYSSSTTAYKIISSRDFHLLNNPAAGDIAILNDFASGSIKMAAGASSTAHFTIASTGAATFSSSVTATSFFESSDIRLKDVIIRKPSTDSFGAIQYTWKDGRDKKIHWGYSAQDVMAWIPDSVNINSDGHYTLDYNQAHTYKIATLEDRIALLEQELKELKNK